MEEHGGVFPQRYEDIRALAGVGDYTAGAVASIAFHQPVAAVDGNVLRVVARITGDTGDITAPATKKRVARALEAVIPTACPGDFNQAMMELGATVCLPNGAPLCGRCPAAKLCTALREDAIDRLPVKTVRRGRRVEERTVYLIFHGDRVALRRRGEKGLLAGLWEYPNKPAPCSSAPLCWGIKGREEALSTPGKHIFTHIEWRMTARIVEAEGSELPPGWVWAQGWELREIYAIPNAFRFVERAVEDRLGRW